MKIVICWLDALLYKQTNSTTILGPMAGENGSFVLFLIGI